MFRNPLTVKNSLNANNPCINKIGFLPIYIITEDTVEIRIQGGIKAINGISAVFMVESVMAVTAPGKVRREAKDSRRYGQRSKNDNSLFAEILGTATKVVAETYADAPTEYKSTVYGRDMRLSSKQYQTREYHY